MEPLGSGQGAPREDPGSITGVKPEKGEWEGAPLGGAGWGGGCASFIQENKLKAKTGKNKETGEFAKISEPYPSLIPTP